MQAETLQDGSIINEYGSHWLANPFFSVATAALLIIFFIVLMSVLINYLKNDLSKKLDNISDKIDDVDKGVSEAVLLNKVAYNLRIGDKDEG